MRTLASRTRCMLLPVCLLLTCAAPAKTIYVDDDANGLENGSSWIDAYRHLQDALADADDSEKPVEIRVADGVYRPDRSSARPDGTQDRSVSFVLLDGIAIKGGFPGTGVLDPNARDITLYETILSGDLAGDDAPVVDPCDLLTDPTRVENSYAVVTSGPCSRSAVLDGLTITSGNALGAERHVLDQVGAGLLLSYYGADCCPSIKNCTLRGNCAYYGGAAYIIGAAPEFIYCTCLNNAAVEGGAIRTSAWRGQWFESAGEFVIEGCLFVGNYARSSGGAIHRGPGSHCRIERSRFTGNVAGTGGAIWCYNEADIVNCLFTRNIATNAGGALYFGWTTALSIASCTFFGNAAQLGSGIASLDSSREWPIPPFAAVVNTILWDSADEIRIGAHVQMDITFSDVYGDWPGQGNIDLDPLFARPAYWDPNGTPEDPNDDFYVEGDYHLKSQAGRRDPASGGWVPDDVTSPCVDAGDPNSPVGDEPEPNGGRINMGAYGGTAEASKSL